MENDAETSLDDAAEIRRRLAVRARTPWWYSVGFGLAVGILMLANGLFDGTLAFAAIAVAIVLELIIVVAYRRRAPVWVWAWRSTLPAVILVCVVLIGALAWARELHDRGGPAWAVGLIAAGATVLYTALARWADTRWRHSIDRGA